MIVPCGFERELQSSAAAAAADPGPPAETSDSLEDVLRLSRSVRMVQRCMRAKWGRDIGRGLREQRDQQRAAGMLQRNLRAKWARGEAHRRRDARDRRLAAAAIVATQFVRWYACLAPKRLLEGLRKDRLCWDSDGPDSSSSDEDDEDDDAEKEEEEEEAQRQGARWNAGMLARMGMRSIGGSPGRTPALPHLPLKTVAAEVIQSFWRGHRVRKAVRPLYTLAQAAQIAIARRFRGQRGRRVAQQERAGDFAPLEVQSFGVANWQQQLSALRSRASATAGATGGGGRSARGFRTVPVRYHFTSPDEIRFRRRQAAAAGSNTATGSGVGIGAGPVFLAGEADGGAGAGIGVDDSNNLLLPTSVAATLGDGTAPIANEAQAMVFSQGRWRAASDVKEVLRQAQRDETERVAQERRDQWGGRGRARAVGGGGGGIGGGGPAAQGGGPLAMRGGRSRSMFV